MVASWVLIAVLSSLLSQTASASETDEGTGQSKLSGEWLDSVLGLTPRQLRSDKDKEMFWATRGKRMLDNDDFWAIRGKKSELENYLKTKRGGLKPNGLFSSIKRSENSLKRPFLKPNGLFGSFKRNFKPNGLFSTFKRALRSGAYDNFDNFDDEDEFLYDLGSEMEKREDFWAARG